MNVAPGPKGVLGLRAFPGFLRGQNRVSRHLEHAQKYGDVVRYDLGFAVAHVIRNPDDIKHVLVENHANYIKGRGLRKMKVFLGEGLLTSEGEFWKRQRRLTQPAFHRARLAKLSSKMVDAGARMLERWQVHAGSGKPVDIAREMMKLTLDVAAQTLFSVDVSHEAERVGRALTVALQEAVRRTFSIIDIPLRIPTRRNRAYRAAMEDLDRVVYGIIEARRRNAREADDLLTMLMEVKDEETGESMSDKQLRDEVMTLFLAGHETTANQLAWTFYLLSKHPTVRAKLEEEIARVLGDRAPRFEDLPQLDYARMVLEEAMRLYPPAWIFGRTALGPDRIGGYDVPKGSFVGVATYALHRDAKWWPNPEGFDPERFSKENSTGRHKFAYLPFGAGPRICIGNAFAMMEGQLLLAMIVQSHRLSLAVGAKIELEPLITLRPRWGVPMTIDARSHAL